MNRTDHAAPAPRMDLVRKLQAEIAAGTYLNARRHRKAAGRIASKLRPLDRHTRPQLLAERDRCEAAGDLARAAQINEVLRTGRHR